MHHDPTIQHLIRQLVSIISGYDLSVKTHMIEEMKLIVQHLMSYRSSLAKFSITLIDLKEWQLLMHQSSYNEYFNSPTLCTGLQNNQERIFHLTCPRNLAFCLQTEIIMMAHLQQLSTEQLSNFEVRYIRNLEEKDGQLHSYVHYGHPFKFDERGRIWIMKYETKRMVESILPEFRWFSHSLKDYTEEHAYSKHLQNLKLSPKEEKILRLLTKDKTMGAISEAIYRSPDTVQSYYTRLKKKLNVQSIEEVREIGRILGY